MSDAGASWGREDSFTFSVTYCSLTKDTVLMAVGAMHSLTMAMVVFE